ncbi:MAG: hypothetical protein PHT59_03955 [Candidatus Omnitrophica bacterium]|nr:hypothetical protein [Candidatus Omnitrophota bacterium]
MNPLRKTLFVSLAGHAALCGLFAFSFQKPVFDTPRPAIVYWGNILPQAAFVPGTDQGAARKPITQIPGSLPRLDPAYGPMGQALEPDHRKPYLAAAAADRKPELIQPAQPLAALPSRQDTSITFHPLLPYQLQVYFKDRQAVHIELVFNIAREKGKNTVEIKRKISSGNLEADLLSARYINHYLFIQQSRFAPDQWQTVRIDLSSKHD